MDKTINTKFCYRRLVLFIAIICGFSLNSLAEVLEYKGYYRLVTLADKSTRSILLLYSGKFYRLEGPIPTIPGNSRLSVNAEEVSPGVLKIASMTFDPPPAPILGERRIAVIIADYADQRFSDPVAATSNVTAFFSGVGPGSIRSYFEEISYGLMTVSFDVKGVVSASPPVTCDAIQNPSLTSEVLSRATDMYGSLDGYQHTVIILKSRPGCSRRSYASGARLAVLYTNDSNIETGVAAHEILHMFGLGHADGIFCANGNDQVTFPQGNCTAIEYGDPLSVMGSGRPIHPSSWEKLTLGWLPQSSVITVDHSGYYEIAASEALGSTPVALKFPRGLLNLKNMNDPKESYEYWIEYRQGNGSFDSSTSYDVSGMVIRFVPKFFRYAPPLHPIRNDSFLITRGGPLTLLASTNFLPGQTFEDTETGVRITAIKSTGAETDFRNRRLTVHISLPSDPQTPVITPTVVPTLIPTPQPTLPLKPNLVIAQPNLTFFQKDVVSVQPITNNGSVSVTCRISPKLPSGLRMIKKSCTIAGTARKTHKLSKYTITATNPHGQSMAEISIQILRRKK